MTTTRPRVRHAQTYTLTDADRAYVAEASAAFASDYRYLEQILWTARKALDRGETAAAPPPTRPPPPAGPPPEQVVKVLAGLEPRLARYLDVDRASGCLVWTGSLTGAGQPVLRLGADQLVQQVRRWVYEQLDGPIPGKRRALSEDTCRPRCVRPDHVVVLPEGVHTRARSKG